MPEPTSAEKIAEFYIRLAQRNPTHDPRELALTVNALMVKARYIQKWAQQHSVTPKQKALLKEDYAWMDHIGHILGISTLANTKPGVLVVYFMATEKCDAVKFEVPLR